MYERYLLIVNDMYMTCDVKQDLPDDSHQSLKEGQNTQTAGSQVHIKNSKCDCKSIITQSWHNRHTSLRLPIAYWALVFTVIIICWIFQYFLATTALGTPAIFHCSGSYWDTSSCGLNGLACQPFESDW